MAFSKARRLSDFIAADGTIPTAKFASSSITSSHLVDGTIAHVDLHTDMDLTGKTVLVANASTGDSDTTAANTAFVQQEIAALVDSSPGTLNTLNELAAALGDDANFSTTVTNSIATKLPLAGGTLTGALTTRDVTVSDGYIMVNGGTTSNTTLEAVLWARSQVGASVAQINVAGDQWQFGGGGTVDTSPTLILDYGDNSATFAGTISSGAITSSGRIDITTDNSISEPYAALGITSTTTSAGLFLHGSGGSKWEVQSISTGDLIFYDRTSGAYRARIMANGNFKIETGNLQMSGTTVIDSSRNLTNIGTISSGAITSSGPITVNNVNDTYNFKAIAGDTDSWFGVYDDANNSANIIVTRSDGATSFLHLGHSGATTINGTLAVVTDVTTQDHRVPAGAGYITYSPSNGASDTLTVRKYGTVQQLFDGNGIQFPNGKVRVNTTTTAWIDGNDQFIVDGRGVFRGYGHSALALGRYNSSASAGETGSLLDFLYGGAGVGTISITTNSTQYNTTSDVRLKDNIKTIVDGSSKIMAMNPVSHTWKANPTEDAVHGFIAQEMKDIVPESVTGEPEGEEMMQMDYGRITPVIVAGLQDALKEIEELKNRIKVLENK